MKRLLRTLALAAAFVMPAVSARAQGPAELAPADTQVYLHIDGFHAWYDMLTEGPAGQAARAEMEAAPQWQLLLALLEMDTNTFLATYFGGDVVVFAPRAEQGAKGVVFTQVAPDAAEHARARLFLEAAGNVGDAALYQTADGGGYIAILDGWVGLCDAAALDYMRGVLDGLGDDSSLATNAGYAEWTGLLPAERGATMYLTAGEGESHALGVSRVGNGMDIAYFGESDAFDTLLGMLGETATAEFGPLPADTLAAASFNIEAPDNIEHDPMLAGLNMLAAPASFVDDILPKLGTPTVLFMAAVDGDDTDPAVGLDVPVVGMALKMDDDSVAADLTTMVNNAMLLANLATLQWGTDPISFTQAEYEGVGYRVAHVGVPLAQQSGWPELEAVQVVYGRVGDYYLVCTQENYFRQCVDAHAGGQPMRMQIEGPVHDRAHTPIMAITVRPDGFADLLRTWDAFVQNEGDGLGLDVPAIGDGMDQAIRMLDQFSLMKVQLWRGDDGLVVGRIQITAPF